MQSTGSKAWQRLYMELTSTILVDLDIEGKTKKISLSELRNLAYEKNESDVGVLAHEIGHAYHSYCLRNEKMLNTDYPTPIAETASIFCETIVNNALLNLVPRNEGFSILEKSISDVGYYIVDFYARYLFEIELFERRKAGQLSVDELNEFLNFPYSFGVLFSKGLYAEYIKKGEDFVFQYNNFLSASSKNNIVDIAKTIDIDVHSIDFWRNALKLIQKDIETFISRV